MGGYSSHFCTSVSLLPFPYFGFLLPFPCFCFCTSALFTCSDFAALSLLRFPLELTSKSGFSVSFQIMPSILESEKNSTRKCTVVGDVTRSIYVRIKSLLRVLSALSRYGLIIRDSPGLKRLRHLINIHNIFNPSR